MIRVVKPEKVPKVLDGERKKRHLKALWQAHKLGEKLDFKSKIYAAKSVKNALIKAQAGKCAFCESNILHIDYADVEHFRPKAGWVQEIDDPLQKPGYFWLAYEWENLFLSCQLCNQRFKKNAFPLFNPRSRATPRRPSIQKEKPKLVSPDENGEEFIAFHAGVPFGIDIKGRGEATIEVLNLDRPRLNSERHQLLRSLKFVYTQSLEGTSEEAVEAARLMEDVVSADAPYASAVRSAVADGFAGVPWMHA